MDDLIQPSSEEKLSQEQGAALHHDIQKLEVLLERFLRYPQRSVMQFASRPDTLRDCPYSSRFLPFYIGMQMVIQKTQKENPQEMEVI